MNTIILIKLIAAHLTGDFLLQSDRMCVDKFSNNSKAKYKPSSFMPWFRLLWHTFSLLDGTTGLYR